MTWELTSQKYHFYPPTTNQPCMLGDQPDLTSLSTGFPNGSKLGYFEGQPFSECKYMSVVQKCSRYKNPSAAQALKQRTTRNQKLDTNFHVIRHGVHKAIKAVIENKCGNTSYNEEASKNPRANVIILVTALLSRVLFTSRGSSSVLSVQSADEYETSEVQASEELEVDWCHIDAWRPN